MGVAHMILQVTTATGCRLHLCVTEESHGVLDLVLSESRWCGLGNIRRSRSNISLHAADAASIHEPLCDELLTQTTDPVYSCYSCIRACLPSQISAVQAVQVPLETSHASAADYHHIHEESATGV